MLNFRQAVVLRVYGFVFCLFVSGLFRAQTHQGYTLSYKIYECAESCKDTAFADYSNGSLLFSFGIWETCSDKPDSVLVTVNQDTLRVLVRDKYYHSAGKSQQRSGPRDVYCLCYFRIDVRVHGINYKPSYYDLGSVVFTEKFGMLDKEWHNRIKQKDQTNNSALLSLEKVREYSMPGKYDDWFKEAFNALGNDSIIEEYVVGSKVLYDNDGIYFSFGNKDIAKEIHVNRSFKGELFYGARWDLTRKKIERKTGSAINIKDNHSDYYDDKGRLIQTISGYICTYQIKGKKLVIVYGADFLPQEMTYYFN